MSSDLEDPDPKSAAAAGHAYIEGEYMHEIERGNQDPLQAVVSRCVRRLLRTANSWVVMPTSYSDGTQLHASYVRTLPRT